MKVCQHCGGQVIKEWDGERCFQCRRNPKSQVPTFTEEELAQERRATHSILQRADYSRYTR